MVHIHAYSLLNLGCVASPWFSLDFNKNVVQRSRADIVFSGSIFKDRCLHQKNLPPNDPGDPIDAELYRAGSSLASAV
jgi:hypothetical protein